MGAFAKADIVLYPFPYTDLSNRKIRPCLVLSDEMRGDIVLCQITSKNTPEDEYSISLKHDETLHGSLRIESYIRTNKLFTADKNDIKMKLCKIGNEKYSKVIKAIIKFMSK